MGSKLLTNTTIITFNPDTSSTSVLRDSHLLIEGDTITHISSDLSTIPKDPNTEILNCSGKIICPGFIDTHRHVFQTAFRTIGPNVTLAEYFFKYSPMCSSKDAFTPNDIYTSTLTGYADALNSGVTTILDHAHNTWQKDIVRAGFNAAQDSGARVWWCFDPTGTVSEGWGYDEQVTELNSFAETLSSTSADPLVKIGLAFDGLERASLDRIAQIKKLIQNLNLGIMTTHYLGGTWPAGANSPSLADKHGLLDLPIAVIFSHGGYIPDSDIQLLRSKNHYLAITPESEMHYGHGQVNSRKVQDHASLGIDTAWTFSGDLLTQARIWLQSNRLQGYETILEKGKIPAGSPMAVEQAFLLITRQAGLALRRDDIGVLKVGAKADIVIFDGESPNMVGYNDAVAAVVLHANVGDIEGVIVGGKWRKRDRMLLETLQGKEWQQLRGEFTKTARTVQDKVSRQDVTLPGDFFGVGYSDVEKVVL